MNWSTGFSWLAAFTARRAMPPQPADRADMGTAFGLDASLAPAPDGTHEPLPALSPMAPDPWARRIVRRSGL